MNYSFSDVSAKLACGFISSASVSMKYQCNEVKTAVLVQILDKKRLLPVAFFSENITRFKLYSQIRLNEACATLGVVTAPSETV